jgi:hypothetical protein
MNLAGVIFVKDGVIKKLKPRASALQKKLMKHILRITSHMIIHKYGFLSLVLQSLKVKFVHLYFFKSLFFSYFLPFFPGYVIEKIGSSGRIHNTLCYSLVILSYAYNLTLLRKALFCCYFCIKCYINADKAINYMI